jgi:hypothetical protein
MKVRYHRTGTSPDVVDYTVETQARPRGRWTSAGMVSRFGRDSWAALGVNATAWTSYRLRRAEAVADMLAGRTFYDDQPVRAA